MTADPRERKVVNATDRLLQVGADYIDQIVGCVRYLTASVGALKGVVSDMIFEHFGHETQHFSTLALSLECTLECSDLSANAAGAVEELHFPFDGMAHSGILTRYIISR